MARVGREQFDEIPLLFGDATTDRGEFVRAHGAAEMHGGLAHAPDAPLERLRDKPPMQRVAIDGAAAGAFVRGDELVDRSHAADLERRTESPRLDAQPPEVFEGIADVYELPVDRGRQSVVVDDQIAEPQVAVHDRRRRTDRPVRVEPRVGLVDRRTGVVD